MGHGAAVAEVAVGGAESVDNQNLPQAIGDCLVRQDSFDHRGEGVPLGKGGSPPGDTA